MNPETNRSSDKSADPQVASPDGLGRVAAGADGGEAAGGRAASTVAPAWNELPVPDGPDRHDEFNSRSLGAPGGFRLVGARVRGKKHKHEGTNCDDWFEFVVSGDWTIIAVADGAGSRAFSRVGARESCESAVTCLSDRLINHAICPRDVWTAETFARNPEDHAFLEPDLSFVQTALFDAMETGRNAVESAAARRDSNPSYETVLGRSLTIDDLSSTLILVVHTIVSFRNSKYSLGFACQIGDGISAALFGNNALQLLGTSDCGKYSGETAFLASVAKLGRSEMYRRTHTCFGPLRALMVMTDGVADDYFPNDPGMHRLYDDLLARHVITSSSAGVEKSPLEARDVPPTYSSNLDREALGEPLREAEEVTESSESPPLNVAETDPAHEPKLAEDTGESAEERLRVWLDSYQVRGSFDDRTLIVLYPEV